VAETVDGAEAPHEIDRVNPDHRPVEEVSEYAERDAVPSVVEGGDQDG